jgi:hypothetical protein
MVSAEYPSAMGFTGAEVAQMTQDLGYADKLAELRDWYDGYRIDGHEIYNPWSVICYFQKKW